eukprot:CAMPEP_0197187850 /NCGR_PEP_ID=MMETSP1423-20130617/16710_1 /TAXON_ID=476441 /ORGANISM="Pseudo-nitzschia heimii, Strain UNC1101" /LENGTH=384 /DNA_ID=CAMNT_0042639531 /DNA_START=69 /DNA_END=1223 /DNA_ORIENTATION=+
MIANRCPLTLCFGLFGLVSTILSTDVYAFALITARYRSNRVTRSSRKTKENSCSISSRIKFSGRYQTPTSTVDTGDDGSPARTAASRSTGAVGLYKQYADYALEQLMGTGWLQEDSSIPESLSVNQAPARGTKTESIVRITTSVLVPNLTERTETDSLVRYARIALLETVPRERSDDETETVSSEGIQVLNFVVLPRADTNLPVLGIDLVSLPGSKHLLLLDAQPMVEPNPHEGHWEDWYNQHVRDIDDDEINNGDNGENMPQLKYAWGGDFPENVKKYVSTYALWTRLQNLPEAADDEITARTSPAVDAIQGELFDAFREHLDAYLELLGNFSSDAEVVTGENNQLSYLDYRRNNDPAKPMLNSLYGAEWTQSLLDNVLFPKD